LLPLRLFDDTRPERTRLADAATSTRRERRYNMRTRTVRVAVIRFAEFGVLIIIWLT
jgi:hypothetical protein